MSLSLTTLATIVPTTHSAIKCLQMLLTIEMLQENLDDLKRGLVPLCEGLTVQKVSIHNECTHLIIIKHCM